MTPGQNGTIDAVAAGDDFIIVDEVSARTSLTAIYGSAVVARLVADGTPLSPFLYAGPAVNSNLGDDQLVPFMIVPGANGTLQSEIASLGRSFTTMVDALGTSRREQQRLVSDASHELRTPLTSLRTNAELLARADRLTPEQQAAVVEGIELEVDELTHLVTELVEGSNLSQVVKGKGPFAEKEAIAIIVDLLRALVDVHDNGIVHRDIKPENMILVAETGAARGTQVKLIDFGVARHEDESMSLAMTREGAVLSYRGRRFLLPRL